MVQYLFVRYLLIFWISLISYSHAYLDNDYAQCDRVYIQHEFPKHLSFQNGQFYFKDPCGVKWKLSKRNSYLYFDQLTQISIQSYSALEQGHVMILSMKLPHQSRPLNLKFNRID